MATLQYVYFTTSPLKFLLYRTNEHLPFVAMPLFLADNLWFSARGVSLIGLIVGLNALISGVLIAQLRTCWGRRDLDFWAASGLIIAIMFWLIHYENLVWPAQLHVYLSAFFVLLAGQYAASRDLQFRQHNTANIKAAIVVGLLLLAATFSFASGAIGWLVILLFAIIRRWRRPVTVILIAMFAANAAIYAAFYDYARTAIEHSNPLTSLGHPIEGIRYVVYYLAGPVIGLLESVVDRNRAISAGVAVAVAALTVATIVLVRVLVTPRKQITSAHLFVSFLILLAVGTAVMTALSRLKFGPEQALSSRYAIVQVFFWVALGLGCAIATRNHTRIRRALLVSGGGAVVLLIALTQTRYASIVEARLQTHWQSVLALMNEVDDKESLASLHPEPHFVQSLARDLRVRNWSIYATPPPHWLKQSVDQLFRKLPAERCMGAFDIVSDLGRLTDRSYAEGWAWDLERRRPAEWIVLIDANGVIRGLGRTGWYRRDVGIAHPSLAGTALGWRAYVTMRSPMPKIEAYAVVADQDSICPLHRNTPR